MPQSDLELNRPFDTQDELLSWQKEGLNLNAFGRALRRKFGGRIQRVSIDAGFTCPNVDGAVTTGGCNFCDNRSFSPSRRVRLKRVSEQLQAGIERVVRRYDRVDGFIAYFQPATNTYAPVNQLEEIYDLAVNADPRIVGLAIGTRPDCTPDSVLNLLEKIAAHHTVSLEFGMQSVHDESLRWMNRAHTHEDMINAIDRARGRGFECCAHVILGVPGEDHAMMMQTAKEIGILGFDSIKLHNLYCVRGTPLGDEVESGKVQMMEREPYIQTVVDFLERIPPEVIVERVSGDAPPKYLIAPQWCLEKAAIRIEIDEEFQRRGTRQGSHFVAPEKPPHERERPIDNTPPAILDQIDARGRLPILKIQGGVVGGLHRD
ncbi:MAG: TIGR01212 family radical SAM protein [Rhodopirellula sp. JB053]